MKDTLTLLTIALKENEELTAINAELLEALTLVVDDANAYFQREFGGFCPWVSVQRNASMAIDKAKNQS